MKFKPAKEVVKGTKLEFVVVGRSNGGAGSRGTLTGEKKGGLNVV